MKLGFITSILQDYDFAKTVDFAAQNKFGCLEVACWPNGKAERRYAGVSHIDTEKLNEDGVRTILALCGQKDVSISSLAYYPNVLDADAEKRAANINHLLSVIDASAALKVNMVTTFIGRDQTKNVEDNFKLVAEVWPRIIEHAESKGVKIAIENCPMLFGREQWPGGQNIFTSPANWRAVFDILKSDNLGINYDPSHFVWQMIDYIKPIYEFRDKIFHVHIKDIKLYPDKLNDVGIMAYPLDFMAPKICGMGDVDWGAYMSTLRDIGYDGPVCLEIEDRSFESGEKDILNSIILSKRYMEQFFI